MDLTKIANTPGFGSGKSARDLINAKAERRNQIPDPATMNEMMSNDMGAPIAHFGNDSDDGKDYSISADGYGSTTESEGARHDARAFVALWNAYRDGDLVWKEDQS